jgi:hypothetical protein
MKLLDIDMPPSARIIWASPEARGEWEPKLNLASRAYSSLEQNTVLQGVRACTTTHIDFRCVEQESRRYSKMGLVFLPLRKVGHYSGFAHRHPPVIEGKPWSYYGPLARTIADAEAFADATDRGDHRAIGNLLGYPVCCQDFFSTVWSAGYVDPIWQAAENCADSVDSKSEYEIRLNSRANHLVFDALRYMGVRLVPHLACSFECQDSLEVARSWLRCGHDSKVAGLEDLISLLEMEFEWACLKGVAIVTTPIFRIVTNSMPCFPRYTVTKAANAS